MTYQPVKDIPQTVMATQKQQKKMMINGQKRVPWNRCEDFIKLIANWNNFLFVLI